MLMTNKQKGAEIMEFALVFPLLMVLLIGMVWIGAAFSAYASLVRAAREGARFAVLTTCATCGNSLPTTQQVQAVVAGAMRSAAMDPSKATITQRNCWIGGNKSPQCDQKYLSDDPPVLLTEVAVSYPYILAQPFGKPINLTLTASARSRAEQQ
jgi:Flp pilus assembly protein TadG